MKNKTWKKWTTEEINLLQFHWKTSTMKDLLSQFPDRDYNSLMLKASQLGIKSEIKRKRIGSLKFLDSLTPGSCYWWGFIMADGHLSKKGELIVTLNKKDKNHLLKLAKHLDRHIHEKGNFCTLRVQDKAFGNKWLDTFKIDNPKTYFPPDLSIFLNKDMFINFMLGFIDGDGCIWESKNWLNLRVELHGNWFSTLHIFSNKLKEFYEIKSKVNMTKRGYSKLEISTKKDLIKLKKYIGNVEYLSRKWDKLNKLK